MKVYGNVQIGEGGDIQNLSVNHGPTYPSDPNTGELFYHDVDGLSIHDGSQWHKVINSSSRQLTNPIENELVVCKNPSEGQFASIAVAMQSIADSSETNPYHIVVGPGVYVESSIIFKPFVSVKGAGQDVTVIQPESTTQHLIETAERGMISDLTLTGATGNGYAAVHSINNSGSTDITFNIENCRFGSNATHVLCEKGYVSVDGCFWGSTFGFDYGFIARPLDDNTAARILIRNSTSTGIVAGLSGTSPKKMFVADGHKALIYLFSAFARFSGQTIDPTSVGLHIRNGGTVLANAALIERWGTGIWVENAGAPPLIAMTGVDLQSNLTSLNVEHIGTTGNFSGIASRSNSYVHPDVTATIFYNDVVDQGIVNVGPMYIGPNHSELADVSPLISQGIVCGLLDGGEISKGTGLNVNVQAGVGYVKVNTVLTQVKWSASSISVPNNESSYVYANSSGTIQTSTAIPNSVENVILGMVVSANSDILLINKNGVIVIHEFHDKVDRFHKLVHGPCFVSGGVVTENTTTARAIDITPGHYFYSSEEYLTEEKLAVQFIHTFHNNGQISINVGSVVDNSQYDNGTNLVNLTTGYFTKHVLYVVGGGSSVGFVLNHGNGNFATIEEARMAPLPSATFIPEGSPAIAAIIVQQGNSNFVETIDIRPMLSMGNMGGAATAVTSHGDLTGLLNNDHPQYLLKSGQGAMTGALDMGSNPIINAGSINGMDFLSHGSRHGANGADAIPTAAPNSSLTPSSSNSVGVANSLSRSDHTHQITGFQQESAILSNLVGLSGTSGILRKSGASNWALDTSTYLTGNQTINFTGDASGSGSTNVNLTLANSGVVAGTYNSVTVDAKGRVTLGANKTAVEQLGYTPLNKAGDILGGSLGFPSTAGTGITIGNQYGWRDLLGDVSGKVGGGAAPSQSRFYGNMLAWAYSAGDQGTLTFHLPHDYAPGTDLFFHFHWAHNGTAITGQIVFNCLVTYAKGHGQQSFVAPITSIVSAAGLNISNCPRYMHRIEEVQLSTPGGSSNMLNTDQIEVDGIVHITFTMNTIPSISGSSTGVNAPFLISADIHYQSTGIPTKNKSPSFYV